MTLTIDLPVSVEENLREAATLQHISAEKLASRREFSYPRGSGSEDQSLTA